MPLECDFHEYFFLRLKMHPLRLQTIYPKLEALRLPGAGPSFTVFSLYKVAGSRGLTWVKDSPHVKG